MQKSLINLIQCRNFGIKICDEPTDPHMKLAIKASGEIFIQMAMEVSTCGTIKNPQTEYYIHDFQHIIISYEFYWNPSNSSFGIYSLYEEYRTSSNFHLCINLSESIIPCTPLTMQCRDNLGLQKFNRAMENIHLTIP